MRQSFYTIKENVTDELVEKKAHFMAYVFYVTSEDDVNARLDEIRKINRDARHNVFAYRLESGLERYSDDGEPSGTAGVPILDILRGENLFNVLIIVTRYFGGILLGTGGLVRAYSGAAKLALEKTSKVEMTLCAEYKVVTEYDNYNSIQHYCKNNNIIILNTSFLDKIEIDILVKDSYKSQLLHDLSEITNRKATYEELKKYYHE